MDQRTDHHHDDGRAPKRRRVGQAEADKRSGPPLHHLTSTQEQVKQYGHLIGNVDICDTAAAHLGDEYITNNYYATAQPQPGTCETLLASLTFDRMDARAHNIATALPITCDWLPNHPDFLAWIDDGRMHEHHGFLWIKGKPGSGKSTIMKETLAWAERTWSGQLILSYFFNARSPHPLEKSSLGLYRSLLYQLLRLLPAGRTLFATRFASKVGKNEVEDWTEIELQNFLIQLVGTLQIPSITLFIDALDEGDDDDVRQMVKFLERLTQYSTPLTQPLRVCLSSRHYPHISVVRSCSLVIENQAEHSRDIELYIRSQLPGEDSPEMDSLRQAILERSAGIFLWVVLVVRVLNKAYDQGSSTATMFRELATTPPDLYDVFDEVFLKDPDGLDDSVVLFQWVLFSKRPLSPIELFHAVQYTCSQTEVDEATVVTLDVATRYLVNHSRGLVKLTGAREPVAQFFHETVRAYLMNRHLYQRRGSRPPPPHISEQNFRADICHGKLSEVCLRYMLQSFKKVSSIEELHVHYPLVLYAAEYWWQHLQSSQSFSSGKEIKLALDLLIGSRSNLLFWVQLYDIDKRQPNPRIVVDNLADPLYYAASIDRRELISGVLGADTNIDARGGLYGTALQAASHYGHEEVVQMLLDQGATVDVRGGLYGNALNAAIYRGHERIVRILLEKGANFNTQEGLDGAVLQMASKNGHEKVVKVLLDQGVDVNARAGQYGTALQMASRRGHDMVVQILLDRGADVNARAGQYGTAVQIATKWGHENVVQILLERGARPNNEL